MKAPFIPIYKVEGVEGVWFRGELLPLEPAPTNSKANFRLRWRNVTVYSKISFDEKEKANDDLGHKLQVRVEGKERREAAQAAAKLKAWIAGGPSVKTFKRKKAKALAGFKMLPGLEKQLEVQTVSGSGLVAGDT